MDGGATSAVDLKLLINFVVSLEQLASGGCLLTGSDVDKLGVENKGSGEGVEGARVHE